MADDELSDAAGRIVDDENPWPGLVAYREADRHYFNGREDELDELLRTVRSQRLTVLFGTSGLGKTSLLRAGLFPELREEYELPVYVRLDFSASPAALSEQVFAALRTQSEAAGVRAPTRSGNQTLWEYLHLRDDAFWNERHRLLIPVLVLDQFEELFTLGLDTPGWPPFVRGFLDELADLAEGRAPAALREQVAEDPQVRHLYDLSRHRYRVVLSLREDYLAALEDSKARMPSVLTCRYRLQPMNGEQALKVVDQTKGRLITTEVARMVVRFAAGRDIDQDEPALADLQIDPSLLSLFCRELNDRRRADGAKRISKDLVRNSENKVVEGFYETSLKGAPAALREFVEDQLVTGKGQRESRTLEAALVPGEVTEQDVSRLVNARLLRIEDRAGVRRIELTHDVLSRVVREARARRRAVQDLERQQQAERERLLREKRLAEESAERERLLREKELAQVAKQAAETEAQVIRLELEKKDAETAQLRQEARSSRRLRALAGGLLVVSIAALGAAVWAYWQSQQASREKAMASLQEEIARREAASSQEAYIALKKAVAAATSATAAARDVRGTERDNQRYRVLVNEAEDSLKEAQQALRTQQVQKVASLSGYKIDIFHLRSSDQARERAERIRSDIKAAGFGGTVQLRPVEPDFFAGPFKPIGLEIRYENPSELEAASRLKEIVSPSGNFSLRTVRNATPSYLSIFVPPE